MTGGQVVPRPSRADYSPASPGGTGRGDDQELSLVAVLDILVRRWRFIVFTPLAALILLVAALAIRGPRFAAYSRFVPQVPRSQAPGNLAGLAAQFGVSLGSASAEQSVDFYAKLLKSRELLDSTADTRYRFAATPGSTDSLTGNLMDLYDLGGATREKRLQNVVRRLERDVSVSTDPKANMITLRTEAPWEGLAVLVNRRLLELMTEFNQKKRQSQAGAERAFVEERMRDAASALAAAEQSLERFLEANRRYQDAPQLMAEHTRLLRRVELRQGVYTTLANNYEQARIEEVRNTPVTTLIERPESSAQRSGSRAVLGISALIIGLALGTLFAFSAEYFDQARERAPERFRHIDRLTTRLRRAATPRA